MRIKIKSSGWESYSYPNNWWYTDYIGAVFDVKKQNTSYFLEDTEHNKSFGISEWINRGCWVDENDCYEIEREHKLNRILK